MLVDANEDIDQLFVIDEEANDGFKSRVKLFLRLPLSSVLITTGTLLSSDLSFNHLVDLGLVIVSDHLLVRRRSWSFSHSCVDLGSGGSFGLLLRRALGESSSLACCGETLAVYNT